MPYRILTLIAAVMMALTMNPARAERNLQRPPGTTRYAPMLDRLRALAAYDHDQGSGRMTLGSIGKSWKGRDLWMVTLHDPTVDPAATKRIVYICRQHGHEPASTEAALSFVDTLVHADSQSALGACLRAVTVYIIPMANPDGAERFLRHNAHDIDINRDWLKQTQPETRALMSAIKQIRPDEITDQHELFPDDRRGDFTEAAGPDAGCAPGVTETCEELSEVVRLSMWTQGCPVRTTLIDDRHPAKLAHRYGSLVAGIPTILFETNRTPGRGRSVADRAKAHERFMTIILRDAAGERNELLAEAQAAGVGHVRQPAANPPLAAIDPDSQATPDASDPDMEGQ